MLLLNGHALAGRGCKEGLLYGAAAHLPLLGLTASTM